LYSLLLLLYKQGNCMSQDTKVGLRVCLIIAAFLGIPTLIAANTHPAADPTKPVAAEVAPSISCNTERIEYEVTREPDPGRYIGEESGIGGGEYGEREVCVNDDSGETVSNTVTLQPVAATQYYGTAVEEDESPGAICADGWRSYSTGRGTCSHHGGVSQWVY
jgi:hypothetical protein